MGVDPLALGFIALAAVLHAAWNILLKTVGDPLRTATAGIVAASAVLVPVVIVGWLATGQPGVPLEAWIIGIVSGGVEVAYFVFLAAAYRRSDLSVVGTTYSHPSCHSNGASTSSSSGSPSSRWRSAQR